MLKDKETSKSKNILKALPPIFYVEGAQTFREGMFDSCRAAFGEV